MRSFKLYPTPANDVRQRYGNYLLGNMLGSGGSALVYLGIHRYLGTQAAVKILHTTWTDADVRRLLAEARIAAQLVHPHIIRVLECGQEGHTPYLVMDYAPNGTLHQYYHPGVRLTPGEVITNIWQITNALIYLHSNGFIHRDIKPANVLLGYNNKLLLSDFGITIATNQATTAGKHLYAGTIAYMAPEQIEGNPCFASDQYALGIMTYEWLTGVLPFKGSPNTVLHQHLTAFPPSLYKRNPRIPLAVENVVLRALAKDPRHRFCSIQKFAEALEEAFEGRSNFEIQFSRIVQDYPAKDQPALTEGKNEQKNIWREICTLFALDLLIGVALGIMLYALGVPSQSMWFLFALCMVLIPLGGAFARRSYPIFFLTGTIFVAAALAYMIFHSLILFVGVYLTLLLLSLLMT